LDFDPSRPGENLSPRQVAVADHQSAARLVAAMLVRFNERVDFGVDGGLKHPSGAFSDNLVQRAALVKLFAKRDNLRVELVVYWNLSSVCRSLRHGVSLCPTWAAELVVQLSRIRHLFSTLQEHDF
jgi:hypothetical protein